MVTKPLVLFLAVVLVVALIVQQPVLVLLCGLSLLAVALAALWRRWALHQVEYQRLLSDDHLFPGNEATLTVQVINRKLLPLARLDIFDVVPPEIQIIGAEFAAYGSAGKRSLFRSLALSWYEGVARHYTITSQQRGVYQIGPVFLRSGDPFGFFLIESSIPTQTRFTVYPRLLQPHDLAFDLRRFLGEVRSRQRLIVDPSRTIGVRDYQRDDPLKSIHWNATARRGELQTRLYEPTTDLQVICFVDVDTFEQAWEGVQRDEAERLISTTATIAKQLVEDGQSVGLMTNGVTMEQATLVRIDPGRSPYQLTRILETLASLKPYSFVSMARLLRTAATTVSAGSTIVLISAIGSAATQDSLLRLRQRGHAVFWLFLGKHAPQLPGVTVYHVPQTNRWQQEVEA